MENVTDVPETFAPKLITFLWIDYLLFFLMFGFSAMIGVYYGCFGNKQSTTTEYLLGGKTMKIFPVSMSLIASHLSGITLLGIPAEIYLHGSQYLACIVSASVTSIAIIYLYLPVFYNLQVTSSYEYLKLRFDSRIRLMASFLYILSTFLYVPIVIFIPALAFNQVTGINLHYITPAVCIVCIFYTTLGGLKAVVWTDTLQFSATMGAMCTVFYLGAKSAGGLLGIWEKADEGGRIEFFNMDPDPTTRTTFWGISIGLTITWFSQLAVGPAFVQRFLAVPTMSAATKCVIIMGAGVIVTKCLSVFSGIIMYAKYANCDPLSSGKVNHSDQLLPYYILDVARSIPGLSGLFISGIFSTALSTMSTNLNTLAGTIYEDFLKPYMPPSTTETKARDIMKCIVVISGTLCVILVFVVEKLGGVVQVSTSFAGITTGPLLGLFTLGMMFPFANTKGALYGGLISLAAMTWILTGSQLSFLYGHIKYTPRFLSTEGCDQDFLNKTINGLNATITNQNSESTFLLYRVSFYWYTVIGTIITLIFGLLVSWLTYDSSDVPTDLNLFTPCVQRFVKSSKQCGEYKTVNQALRMVHLNNERTEEIDKSITKHISR